MHTKTIHFWQEEIRKQPPWSKARLRNVFERDFTVNALMYDPCSGLIYDYVGGVLDCERRVLRTVMDPYQSFLTDPARMLRGVRLAASAGEISTNVMNMHSAAQCSALQHVQQLTCCVQCRTEAA